MSVFDYSTPVPNLFWEMYDRWISPSVVEALDADLHRGMLLKLPPNARVADLGCGGGQHSVRMAKARPDLHITGVDIASTMVRRARKLAAAEGVAGRVSFIRGDALRTPFSECEFDAVVCAGPLKQLTDKAGLMHECYRLLKPGGYLLVMDVDRGCRQDDVEHFCERTTLPRWAKRLLAPYFRAFVTAESVDLDDARALVAALPLVEVDGPRRIAGHPALVVVARRAP